MVVLRHFGYDDWKILKENYADISKSDIIKMVDEWNLLNYKGNFFEMFAVTSYDEIVGTVSLYGKNDRVEIGPIIFNRNRRKGYGSEAVTIAIEKAKSYGYKTAVAHIRKDNTASICLHKKLGFVLKKEYINSKGQESVELIKCI